MLQFEPCFNKCNRLQVFRQKTPCDISVGYNIYILKEDFHTVCVCVWMYPRHGYSFKDTTVWSSPNDSKCVRLGVSVLQISNVPIPEVAFKKKRKNLAIFFATRRCAFSFATQLYGVNFCSFTREVNERKLYSHLTYSSTLPFSSCALS